MTQGRERRERPAVNALLVWLERSKTDNRTTQTGSITVYPWCFPFLKWRQDSAYNLFKAVQKELPHHRGSAQVFEVLRPFANRHVNELVRIRRKGKNFGFFLETIFSPPSKKHSTKTQHTAGWRAVKNGKKGAKPPKLPVNVITCQLAVVLKLSQRCFFWESKSLVNVQIY